MTFQQVLFDYSVEYYIFKCRLIIFQIFRQTEKILTELSGIYITDAIMKIRNHPNTFGSSGIGSGISLGRLK